MYWIVVGWDLLIVAVTGGWSFFSCVELFHVKHERCIIITVIL
nr:MAG TPA: hypothetical protein [Caudoviricetes sp.]